MEQTKTIQNIEVANDVNSDRKINRTKQIPIPYF